MEGEENGGGGGEEGIEQVDECRGTMQRRRSSEGKERREGRSEGGWDIADQLGMHSVWTYHIMPSTLRITSGGSGIDGSIEAYFFCG